MSRRRTLAAVAVVAALIAGGAFLLFNRERPWDPDFDTRLSKVL